MEAFVYKWTDKAYDKYYIGSHKGTTDDGYICSKSLVEDLYYQRPEDFTREIISIGQWKEMRKLEEELLTKVNAAKHPDYYNEHNGGIAFFSQHTEESKNKIKQSHIGMKASDSARENMSRAQKGRKLSEDRRKQISGYTTGEKNSFFSKKHSAETKEKMRLAKLGKPSLKKGDPLSIETKKKISEANRGKVPWMKGKKHTELAKMKNRLAHLKN